MRTEFIYSFMALGAIPVVANAAEVQTIDVLTSTTGDEVQYTVGTLVPGKYKFTANVLSKIYDVNVTIGGKTVKVSNTNGSTTAEPVTVEFELTKDTEVVLTLKSTEIGEAGAGFTVSGAIVILDFDFASAKDILIDNAEALAAKIGNYAYAAKEDDVEAANALKTKATNVKETYDDYKTFKFYADKSTIQKEIDDLDAETAAKEAAYWNEQAYNEVNAQITEIKAYYNDAVAVLEQTLVGNAAYLLTAAKAQMNTEINAKITEATQASYNSYKAGTAVADKPGNINKIPTKTAIDTIVNKYKNMASDYNALVGKKDDLQEQLDAIKLEADGLVEDFDKKKQAAQKAIDDFEGEVTGVRDDAVQMNALLTNVEDNAKYKDAKDKIESLKNEVDQANGDYTANEDANTATLDDIETLGDNLTNAQTAVNKLKSKDGKYEAKDYYDDYVAGIQKEISDLATAAATAYEDDEAAAFRTGTALAKIATIQGKIDDYGGKAKTDTQEAVKGMPEQAVDKYDALQDAIKEFETQLAAAREQVKDLAVYTAEGYDYETEFDLIQRDINKIKKAITAAQEKRGDVHWTAMLAIDPTADNIPTQITNLLSQVQSDQNEYDANYLATGITNLEKRITDFNAITADDSVVGDDYATFAAVETGINTDFQVVKTASEKINASSETVEYKDKVSGDAAAWGGVACPGDNSFAETYGNSEAVAKTGTILQQKVTGVENGIYTVELYANANFTSGRGFTSDLVDGATDVAYVFANGKQTPIVAHIDGGLTGEYKIENVVVSDGTLTMGLAKAKAGTNWHTIKIKSLKANTASLIQGWGAKIADLTAQQDVLEKAAGGPEGKVKANNTRLGDTDDLIGDNDATPKTGLWGTIATFEDTYKIGDDKNTTLGNRGKSNGSITKEVGQIKTDLGALQENNKKVDVTLVTNVDKTDLVGKDASSWVGASGLAGTWAAPAVKINGTDYQMAENYNGGSCEGTGTILSQTITGIDNGIYDVVLCANAMAAQNVDNGHAIQGDATDVAYVFANGEKKWITAKKASTTDKNGEFEFKNVLVSENTLKLGLEKVKSGTNWHTIQIKSLTYHENSQLETLQGYADDYSELKGKVTQLEKDAPGIVTDVANNKDSKQKADEATGGLDTYKANLNNLPDVSDATGESTDAVAKKDDPANFKVYETGLDKDETYTAKRKAVKDQIDAMKDAITAANASESLPYPWADEITVITTPDDPATTDVNEEATTTYKVSEIKAAIDAIVAEAGTESTNYWAYRDVRSGEDKTIGKTNKIDDGSFATSIDDARDDLATVAGTTGGKDNKGAFDYYNDLIGDDAATKGYTKELAGIRTNMVASLNARTAEADQAGYVNKLKELKAKIDAVQDAAAANLAKYNKQHADAEATQTLWNNTYTEIAATDESSQRDTYLAKLDAIQTDLTAAANAVEENYVTGKSVENEKNFKEIEDRINTVKKDQHDAYGEVITADNLKAHKTFLNKLDLVTADYNNAVKERANYSSNVEDIENIILQEAATIDPLLYNCPTDIQTLKEKEQTAYTATLESEENDKHDISTFMTDAQTIQSGINTNLGTFKTNVTAALATYWYNKRGVEADDHTFPYGTYGYKLKQAKDAIAGNDYNDEARKDAFKDVEDLIAAGDAAVTAMSIQKLETTVTTLDNGGIDSKLTTDKNNAAKNDIEAKVAEAKTTYDEVKGYINGVSNDIPEKSEQLTALETSYKNNITSYAAQEWRWSFNNHGYLNDAINSFNSTAAQCKKTVEDAVAADNANTDAYNEMTAYIAPVADKLEEAKAKAAGYKYETSSFTTNETNLATITTNAENYKNAGTAVANKKSIFDAVDVLNADIKNPASIETTLYNTFYNEKNDLSADITELKSQYNTYVAANGYDTTAEAFKKDIDGLEADLLAIDFEDKDDPADGLQYDELLAGTAALIQLENDIADKQTELLAVNAPQANTNAYDDLTAQLSTMTATATLADSARDQWVGGQTYNNSTIAEAAQEILDEIDDLSKEIEDDKANISFYKDKYQDKINAINKDLNKLSKQISDKRTQYDRNTEAYETLDTQLKDLQQYVDDAKEQVGEYVHASGNYWSLIESYTNGKLSGGVQFDINQKRTEIDAANGSKTAQDIYDMDWFVNSKRNIVKKYLDDSTFAEFGGNPDTEDTNLGTGLLYDLKKELNDKLDRAHHEGVEKYSPVHWELLTDTEAEILGDIADLDYLVWDSYQTYKSTAKYEWDTYYNYQGILCYRTKVRTSGADYDKQMEKVAEIKAKIADLEKRVKNLKLLGDANVDGKVNVLDYQKVLNMILDPDLLPEEGSELFVNLDINQSKVIEVGDLTSIVNYILKGNWQGNAAARGDRMGSTSESLSMNALSTGQSTQRFAVNLENAADYTAFQLDVVLPTGMKIVGCNLSDRASESHQLYSRGQMDGSTRVVASSVLGESFRGNEGAVLYIDVETTSDYMGGNMELLNILFSDTNANTRSFTLGSDATGIDGMSTFESLKQKVYDLGGRVKNGVKKGINILRRADGSTQKVVK